MQHVFVPTAELKSQPTVGEIDERAADTASEAQSGATKTATDESKVVPLLSDAIDECGGDTASASLAELQSGTTETAADAASWRDSIGVHPAAELFPPMRKAELAELGKSIKANGLISPIVLWRASKDAQEQLLDGRSRLDAIEIGLGRPVRITSYTSRGRIRWNLETDDEYGQPQSAIDLIGEKGFPFDAKIESIFVVLGPDTDPYAYVVSANLHRRHLTVKEKRGVIATLLEAMPEKSDRQIGEMIKVDHKTVSSVRAEREATGELSPVEKRVGADGKRRRQPARKIHKAKKPVQRGAPGGDIEANSNGEVARARLDELENEKRQLEIKNVGLQDEIVHPTAQHAPAGEVPGAGPKLNVVDPATVNGHLAAECAAPPPTLAVAWAAATEDEKKTELRKLNTSELLSLLSAATREDIKRRVVGLLTVDQLLAELERKLPGAPPPPKVRAAFKTLQEAQP
jgi:hypothetical protein